MAIRPLRPTKPARAPTQPGRPLRFILRYTPADCGDVGLAEAIAAVQALPSLTIVANHGRNVLVSGPASLESLRELLGTASPWSSSAEQFYTTQN